MHPLFIDRSAPNFSIDKHAISNNNTRELYGSILFSKLIFTMIWYDSYEQFHIRKWRHCVRKLLLPIYSFFSLCSLLASRSILYMYSIVYSYAGLPYLQSLRYRGIFHAIWSNNVSTTSNNLDLRSHIRSERPMRQPRRVWWLPNRGWWSGSTRRVQFVREKHAMSLLSGCRRSLSEALMMDLNFIETVRRDLSFSINTPTPSCCRTRLDMSARSALSIPHE